MNPRVWSLADLIATNLDLDFIGGTLHESGWDIAPARLRELAAGQLPTRPELDALASLGLPVSNTVEWLMID